MSASDTAPATDRPAPGSTGLCLSGGGYRAMLFHLGVLWRLNELGVLSTLDRISSVSGGSITTAFLGLRWSTLVFAANGAADGFRPIVAEPIMALAGQTIDVAAILRGLVLPGRSIADELAARLRALFGTATLQHLPQTPRFVINATNLQSGALWRFSKPYMRDWRVAKFSSPDIELAVAVAASAAFPPFLGPLRLHLDAGKAEKGTGADLEQLPFTSTAVLSDGGVYDNLGLEPVWKRCETVLISDAGQKIAADAEPAGNWLSQMLRVLGVIDNQVRALRKRTAIAGFQRRSEDPAGGDDANARAGAYWSIRSDVFDFELESALPCSSALTASLAAIPTRFKALDDGTVQRLVNWGYACSDAALRKHVYPFARPPFELPFPRSWPARRKMRPAASLYQRREEEEAPGRQGPAAAAYALVADSVAPDAEREPIFRALLDRLRESENLLRVERLPAAPPPGAGAALSDAWRRFLPRARAVGPPRLMIGHPGWSAAGAKQLRACVALLSSPSVGLDSVWFEWTDDSVLTARAAWRWPLRVGLLRDDESRALRRDIEAHPASFYENLYRFDQLTPGRATCDLLLVPTLGALSAPKAPRVSASFVVVFDQVRDDQAAADQLREIRRLTHASGVAFVGSIAARGPWVRSLLREITHDLPLDVAVWSASVERRATDSAFAAPLIVGEPRFVEGATLSAVQQAVSARLQGKDAAELAEATRDLVYDRESGGATDLAQRLVALPHAQEYAQGDRMLQARRVRKRAARRLLGQDGSVKPSSLVEVSIAPHASPGARAFPDLGPTETGHELLVTLVSLNARLRTIASDLPAGWRERAPLRRRAASARAAAPETASAAGTAPLAFSASAVIRLPHDGASSAAVFAIEPISGTPFRVRVLVSSGNRILQTALLDGPSRWWPWGGVGTAIETRVQRGVQGLDDRDSFDGTVAIDGQGTITKLLDEHVKVSFAVQQGIAASMSNVQSLLEDFVRSDVVTSKLDDPTSLAFFRGLAKEGTQVYGRIVIDGGLEQFRWARRIQIVSLDPNAYLPLEFAYDGNAPRDDAPLCPDAEKAIAIGDCGRCPHRESQDVVCPARFWGINRVVERHAFDRNLAGADHLVGSVLPIVGRPFRSIDAAVFAPSLRAGELSGPEAVNALADLVVQSSAAGSKHVTSWNEWIAVVKVRRPNLFVVVPHLETHSGQPSLLIGADDPLQLPHVNATLLGNAAAPGDGEEDRRKPPQIVVLLGCRTALGSFQIQDFPSRLRQAGADLVIGTLSKVLGRHAIPVASRLVQELQRCCRHPGIDLTVGDIMTRLRRDLVKEMPIVLTVTAYGDADLLVGQG